MKRSRPRLLRRRVLIMCEGETERNYFQALKEDPGYKLRLSAVSAQVVKAKNPSPGQVVDEAQQRAMHEKQTGNPYDEVWVILDHDHHPSRKQVYEAALGHGMRVGFSVLAFEVWYLLHFEQSARAYAHIDDLLRVLRRHIPHYEKARQNDFAYLKLHLAAACDRAVWLRSQTAVPDAHTTDQTAWTDVDILVQHLTADR
ncbi:MAG: RloB family protein [Bacteroidia bacterium]